MGPEDISERNRSIKNAPASAGGVYSSANQYARASRKLPIWVGGVGFVLLLIFSFVAYQVATRSVDDQLSVNDNRESANILLPADAVAGLNVDPAQTLDVNGTLRANGSFILQPRTQPSTPQVGEFYMDEDSGTLNYYNGREFVPITNAEEIEELQAVNSIGGLTGDLQLGPNLALNGTVIDAIVPDGGVSTVQGVDGDVNFTGANGISVSGTRISLSLTGGTGINLSNNQVNLDLNTAAGLAINGNTLSLDIEAGSGIGISGNVITNEGVMGLNGAGSIVVTDNGDGTYTIADGGGAGGSVALGPAGAQNDPSLNTSIFINKTGLSGNLLQLQASGNDQFVLGISGDTTQAGDSTVLGGTLTVGSDSQPGQLVLQTGSGTTATIVPATLGQNITFTLPDTGEATAELCTTGGNCLGAGGGAANDNPYLTVTNDPDLQAERALLAGDNLAFTDFGANGILQVDLTSSISLTGSVTAQEFNGANPRFNADSGSLLLQAGSTTYMSISNTGAVRLHGMNCSTSAYGGVLTTDSSGNLICSDDDGGGALAGTAATNIIPKFTNASTLGASSLSDNGSTVTSLVPLAVQGSTVSVGQAAQQTGSVLLYNTSNSNTTQLRSGAAASNIVFTLPTTGGNSGECLISSGSGVLGFTSCMGGVSSVNGLSSEVAIAGVSNQTIVSTVNGDTIRIGLPDNVTINQNLSVSNDLTVSDSVSIADSLSVGSTLSVNNVSNIAIVSGTLRVSNGTNYGSFSAVNLTGNQTYTLPDASGELCLSVGNCVGGSGGAPNDAEYLVGTANGTLTNERVLQAGTNVILTPSAGLLTVELSDSPLFNNVRLGTGANIVTLGTNATGGAATVSVPDTAGANDTVCLLSLSNCFGDGGGGGITGSGSINRLAKFDTAGNITNSSFTDDGASVSVDNVNMSIQGSGSLTVNSSITGNAGLSIANSIAGGSLNVSGDASFDTTTLVVNSTTNRVGIGTTNPTGAILDVQGNVSGVTAKFSGRVQGADGTELTDFVTLGQLNTMSSGGFVQGGNTFGEEAILGTNDAFGLSLETDGTTRLSISATGAISSSQTINSGNLMTLTNTSTLGGVLSISGAVTDQTNVLNVQSNALSVTGSGSVGIGTNNPSAALLDVQGNVGGLSARFSDRVQGVAGTGSNDFVVKSQLDSVNSTFDNVFTRGGNIFGLETKLGTNDAQDLIIVSNTLEVARFTSDRAVQFAGVASGSAPAVSATGNGRMYFDSTNGYFMCSENGGAYFDCFGTGSDAVSSINLLTGGITLAGTANQVSVADNGTNTITLSLPQNIAVSSSPTFAGLSVSGDASFTGTVSGANATDAAHFVTKSQLDSATSGGVSSLNTLAGALTLQGTTNQLSVNTAGSTLTLSLAQDIATTSSVSFAGGAFTSTVSGADAVNADDFATKGQLDAAIASVGGAAAINNSTTTQTANFNIQSAADTDVTAVLKATATQTADLLQAQDSNGNALAKITKDGNIGVGVATPQQRLHISSNSLATGTKIQLDLEDVARSSAGSIDASQIASITSAELDGANSVAVQGNYAYVATAGGFVAVDVTDPNNPIQISYTAVPGGVQKLTVRGSYVHTVAYGKFTTVEVTDPYNPVVRGSISNTSYFTNLGNNITSDDAYVYVVSSDQFMVIDVSDPMNPSLYKMVTHSTFEGLRDVTVVGSYAYAVAGSDKVFVAFNLTNIEAITFVTRYNSDLGAVKAVAVSGNYAYTIAAGTGNTFAVYDITDPAAPVLVTQVTANGTDIVANGNYVYVTSGTSVRVWDVSSPSSPVVHDTETTAELSGAAGIYMKDNYLYVGAATADSFTILTNGLNTSYYTQSWSLGSVRSNDAAFTLQSTNELGSVDALSVLQNGNVGIGALTPDTDLEVLGGLCVSDDAADDCTTAAGEIKADGSITANAFDIAELYPSSSAIEKGTLVSIDTSTDGYVKPADASEHIVGVVSTKPGFVLGWRDNPEFDGVPQVSEVALAGRVPVRVSGPVANGDPISLSEVSGVGQTATQAGRIIGYALSSYHGEGEGLVEVLVNNTYWMPDLQNQDTTGLQNGDLATFATLNVDGPSTFNGNLTVNNNLNINGHIITGNTSESTTVEPGPAACSGAEVSIDGNDIAGTVTITTGTNCGVGGELATIMFGEAYSAVPRVTLTPGNAAASKLQYYRGASEISFTIKTSLSADDHTEYIYDYQVIQ